MNYLHISYTLLSKNYNEFDKDQFGDITTVKLKK